MSGATGNEEVQALSALLNSTESDQLQFKAAAEILSWKIPSTSEILYWNPGVQSLVWTPSGDRLLKWLLSKLCKQGTSSDSLRGDPLAYTLLVDLVLSSPENVVLRHLQHVDLSETLCATLVSIRQDLEQPNSSGNHERSGAKQHSRKRKRSDLDEEARATKRQHGAVLLVAVCRAFDALLHRTRFTQHSSVHIETVKNVLTIPIERAGLIIESGLKCTLEAIRLKLWDSHYPVANHILRPLLSVWTSTRSSTKAENNLYSPRIFAKHCLFPSLLLQYERPDLFLDAFVKQCCLSPFMYANTSQDERKSAISGMLRHLEDFQQSSDKASDHPGEEDDFSSLLKCTSSLIKLTGQIASVHSSPTKDPFGPWFEELFAQLVSCAKFDLDSTESGFFNTEQCKFLADTLEAYQSVGRSPGKGYLAKLPLRCNSQASSSFTIHPWRVISLCLNLEAGLVVQQENNQDANLIRAHVFAQIENVDHQMSSRTPDKENGNSRSTLLLEPLLDALIQQRAILSLISDWVESVERCLGSSLVLSDGKATKITFRTFWERPSVQAIVAKRLSTSIHSKDMHGLIEDQYSQIQALSSSSHDVVKFYARIIAMSTLLGAGREFSEGMTSTPGNKQNHPKSWNANLSRLLMESFIKNPKNESNVLLLDSMQHLHYKAIYEQDKTERNLSTAFLGALCEAIENSLCRKQSPGMYECAFSAWAVVNQRVSVYASNQCAAEVKSLSDRTWSLIARLLKDLRPGNLQSGIKATQEHDLIACDGHFDIRNSTELLYEIVQEAITTHLWTADLVDQSTIIQFIDNLCACAVSTSSMRGPSGEGLDLESLCENIESVRSWEKLWLTFIRSAAAAESHRLWQAIHQALFTSLMNSTTESQHKISSKEREYLFIIRQLQSVNIGSLSARERGKMIDRVTDQLKSRALSSTSISSSLHLLRRLLSIPTKATALVSDHSTIWALAKSLRRSDADIDGYQSLRMIASIIFRYWMIDKTFGPLTQAFVKQLHDQINQDKQECMDIGTAIIIASGISTINTVNNDGYLLDEKVQVEFLSCQLRDLVQLSTSKDESSETMLTLLENITSVPGSIYKAFNWQQRISKLQRGGQLMNGEDLKITTYMDKICKRSFRKMSMATGEVETDNIESWFWSRCRTIQAFANGNLEDTGQLQGSELEHLTIVARQRRMKDLTGRFRELSTESKVDTLNLLVNNAVGHSTATGLIYLRQIVSQPMNSKERDAPLTPAINRVFESTLRDVGRSDVNLLPRLKVLRAILTFNPWSTTQEHIDRTLATLISLTNQSCRLSSPVISFETMLLAELVKLMRIIFQHHRSKIGGRWHLVIDVLKCILRCLFIPNPNINLKDSIQQPQWIRNSQDSSQSMVEDVDSFSRLLCNICDPTYRISKSGKTNSSGTQLLNDSSKAARAISGQHMQHIVAEYCALQLKGHIADSDAIKPGLYAIFDAMSQDVRKCLNESLDAQARVMFKNVFDEWSRFGKWNG